MFSEVVNCCLGGFGDALHEVFFPDGPLILAFIGVDHLLADAAVGTADADVLVGAAKAALDMALEVGQSDQGIIVEHMASNTHVVKVVSADHRQICCAFFIHDIHRAECPSVDLEGLAVLLGRVAVTVIIRVCFNNAGILELGLCFSELFHPASWNDVWSMRLTGMQFQSDFAGDIAVDLFIGFLQAFCGKITCEVDNGFIAASGFIGNELRTIFRIILCHCVILLLLL